MSIVGFTGTRRGMTEAQSRTVERLLARRRGRFRHGMAAGADEQASRFARGAEFYVEGYPGYGPGTPPAYHGYADQLHPPDTYLRRDKAIVAGADELIATPSGYTEQARGSGTWATVRYARTAGVPVCIVWPDGTTDVG